MTNKITSRSQFFHIVLLFILLGTFDCVAQNSIYSIDKEIDVITKIGKIEFQTGPNSGSLPPIDNPQAAGVSVLNIVGGGISLGFKYAKEIQKRNLKKFKHEIVYSNTQNRPDFGEIPALNTKITAFENQADLNSAKGKEVLSFKLTPIRISGNNELFSYELSNFKQNFSLSKINSKHPSSDIAIEIIISGYGEDGKGISYTSSPIIIKSVSPNQTSENSFQQIRTSTFPRNILLTEVKIKITEINSTKGEGSATFNTLYEGREDLLSLLNKLSGQ